MAVVPWGVNTFRLPSWKMAYTRPSFTAAKDSTWLVPGNWIFTQPCAPKYQKEPSNALTKISARPFESSPSLKDCTPLGVFATPVGITLVTNGPSSPNRLVLAINPVKVPAVVVWDPTKTATFSP